MCVSSKQNSSPAICPATWFVVLLLTSLHFAAFRGPCEANGIKIVDNRQIIALSAALQKGLRSVRVLQVAKNPKQGFIIFFTLCPSR
jgi:hypothetical protein